MSRGENTPSGKTTWNCICKCGNTVNRTADSLKVEGVKSCGCFGRESLSKIALERNTVHGQNKVGAQTGAHKSWISMRERCNDKNHSSYKYYGGRGITVCERWNKFENFFEDMGERPHGMTIDRIDNDGNYEPSNCKWSTRSEQQQNKRAYSSTGIKGVYVCPQTKKYISNIRVNGKKVHIGRFATLEEANSAYLSAQKKYFGV